MVVVVICLEVSALIIAFAGLHLHNDLQEFVSKSMKDGLYLYNHDSEQEMKMAWDNLQQEVSVTLYYTPAYT